MSRVAAVSVWARSVTFLVIKLAFYPQLLPAVAANQSIRSLCPATGTGHRQATRKERRKG